MYVVQYPGKIWLWYLKKITKEVYYYEKEVIREKERLSKLENEGKDEYTLKQQEEVIRESARMVPHCMNELQTAYMELKALLESETHLCESEEYQTANVILNDAGVLLAQ
ncbi:Tubulin-specific chaperone A like protein [Argiope bruennichi]|uniref:Tubulin-specific chaperone A n=1 Tax=Argiope bruennichi TaxID=94029 RepID=A0A8T0EDC1_ARGBR|nr:Tubulin-specific chaperone A like protein [Argiope bruennichi]